ncbi:TetR/AcrR family transcriptional regulator, partial [Lachnospiraceae bacterium]|nr:TetR/AcrR family transcriptional regulator [Lachnospiraceae bacterium]
MIYEIDRTETEPLPAKAGRFGLLLKQPKVVATSL